MIDRLLQIHLEPIARNERRARLLRTLAVGWLVAAGVALFLILVHRSSGWVSAWAFLLLVGATLVWTFIAWRRSKRTPLDFQTIARNIEAENPKLHTLLLTAVEQKPDSETHELNYLQDRVIREALAEDRGSLWRKRAARQLQFAQLGSIGALALFAVLSLTLYQAAPPRVASYGMWWRVANSSRYGLVPGRKCGTTPGLRSTSWTTPQGYGGICWPSASS